MTRWLRSGAPSGLFIVIRRLYTVRTKPVTVLTYSAVLAGNFVARGTIIVVVVNPLVSGLLCFVDGMKFNFI